MRFEMVGSPDVWFATLAATFSVDVGGTSVSISGIRADERSFHKLSMTASLEVDVGPTAVAAARAFRDLGPSALVLEPGFLAPRFDGAAEFVKLLDQQLTILTAAADQVGALLRWRYRIAGSHAGTRVSRYRVQADGVGSIEVHLVPQMLVGDSQAYIEENAGIAIQQLLDEGSGEPLGHELLREAWANRFARPRSSFMVGYSAAEIGVKEFVAALVPATAWLVRNAPTPPLPGMLANLISDLPIRRHGRDGVVRVPKALRSKFDAATKLRNDIAHGRAPEPDIVVVERLLRAVEDLLYLLDYFAGEDWAFDMLSAETREDVLGPVA